MQNSAAATTPFTGDSRMRSTLGTTLLAVCTLPLTVVAVAQAQNPATHGVRAVAPRQPKTIVDPALDGSQDAQLGDSIDFFGGRKQTKGFAALITVADWADHYSQMAIYLRLNGLLPPSAKKAD